MRNAVSILGIAAVFFATTTSGATSIVPTQLPQALAELKAPLAITTRGARIELPFRVRIAVKEIDTQSPEARRGLGLSGHEMRDQRGRLIGSENLKCEPYHNALVILSNSLVERNLPWICRAPNYQSVLSDGKLHLEAAAGFLAVGENFYRGTLDLIQKGDKLILVNNLGIEPYLAGLVNREVRSDFPAEAVKAQVIAARSYALAVAAARRKADSDFDLFGSEADQVYDGTIREDSASFRLARETADLVLFHRGDVLKAYFHAASGGQSELPQNVWGPSKDSFDDLAYKAERSEVDAEIKSAQWSIVLSPKMGVLWPGLGDIRNIRVLKRTEGQRVAQIRIDGERESKTLSGADFRNKLGNKWVKSTYFTITKKGTQWLLAGRGWGHGVGLSQWGAKALAESGKTAEQILSHYYPFSELHKLPLEMGESSTPLKVSPSLPKTTAPAILAR